MLGRAFGPAGAPFDRPADPVLAGEVAVRLSLGGRVFVRTPLPTLRADVGTPAAERLREASVQTAGASLAIRRLVEEVASVAEATGVPVALLKLTALEASGALEEGTRSGCDVDLLVPHDGAVRLQAALEANGLRGKSSGEDEHQLPSLAWKAGLSVEIHKLLLGIRAQGGRRSAGFDELQGAGLLERRATPAGKSVLVPRPVLLAAHALAHGIGQHGFAPEGYPLFRLLTDLADIEERLDGGPRLREDASALAARAVSTVEAGAVFRALDLLRQGDLSFVDRPVDLAGALVRHLVASALDPRYARSLVWQAAWHPLSDRPRRARLVGLLRRVFPARADLERLEGRQLTGVEAALLRVRRPADLLGRALASAGELRRPRR